MKIIEIGLSHRQRIAETCISGYVEITDKEGDYAIVIEFEEPFDGDGTLYIELMTDSDDGFHSADTIKKIGPLHSENIISGSTVKIKNFSEQLDRYVCLFYRVTKGSFASGKITARISSEKDPWFAMGAEEV